MKVESEKIGIALSSGTKLRKSLGTSKLTYDIINSFLLVLMIKKRKEN